MLIEPINLHGNGTTFHVRVRNIECPEEIFSEICDQLLTAYTDSNMLMCRDVCVTAVWQSNLKNTLQAAERTCLDIAKMVKIYTENCPKSVEVSIYQYNPTELQCRDI